MKEKSCGHLNKCKKTFDRIQQKPCSNWIKGIYLNIIRAIYNKLTANIILSGENFKAFPPD